MTFSTRHIGSHAGRAASIIELTIDTGGVVFTESVTSFQTNKVDDDLILELRDLVRELEDHNALVDRDTETEILRQSAL